jgi:hypothetical protein
MDNVTTIARHCAAWLGAFCAVLVSPMILFYSAPLVVGVASDIVHAGGGLIAAAILIAGLLRAFA